MEDKIISFEVAKLTKEKGMPRFQMIGFVTKFYHPRTQTLLHLGRTGRMQIRELYYAPTQSLLQKWLREVHNIDVLINTSRTVRVPKANGYECLIIAPTTEVYSWDVRLIHNTYEEALEAGLLKALSLIK